MGVGNGKKQKLRLSAKEKWEIYQECEKPGAPIGEVLRKQGLYSSDLQNIRRDVREGALDRLRQSKPGRKKVVSVPREDFERFRKEHCTEVDRLRTLQTQTKMHINSKR